MQIVIEEITSSEDISYQELFNINKINQAVLEGKDLKEIARLYLETIEPIYSLKASRLYTLDQNRLELVWENFEDGAIKVIEQRIGTKVRNIQPVLEPNNYLYRLMTQKKPFITTDPEEIRLTVEAHTQNSFIRTLSRWAIRILGIKTFGIIPLVSNDEIIGLLSFASTRKFDHYDQRSFIRFASSVSAGLIQKISNEKLVAQKQLSQNLMDVLPIDIAVLDEENRYKMVNKNAIKNDDLREWIIGKTDEEYFSYCGKPMDISNDRTKKLKQIEKSKTPLQWIEHMTNSEGNSVHLLRILKLLTLDNKEYKLSYGIDVSDLIKTQEQLTQTQRIGKLVSWEMKVAKGVVLFGREMAETLGLEYKESGIAVREFYKIVNEKYRAGLIAVFQQLFSNKKVDNYELEITQKNDSTEYFSLNAIPIADSSNMVHSIMGTMMNITDRKNYEKNLKSEQELLMVSEEMGKIGSWEVNFIDLNDWNKNTTRWSDESYRIFGYEPGSVEVSYPFFMEHVHPEDRPLVAIDFKKLLVPGTRHEIEFRIILKDGTIKYLHGKFYVQFDENNVPLKMIGMTQDITLRKELEIELGNYNQKLQSEIKNQTTELIIANQNLDAFNYSISHDLKTPIRGMEIYTELLRDTLNHNEESLEYVDHLQGGIGEIKTMISTLLNFSKYTTVELNKQTVDMRNKIEQSIQSSAANRSPNTRFLIGDTPPLHVDVTLISHVLDNLISNAIKYSGKKQEPVIEITGTTDDAFTTYTIRDNGDGFDEKLAHKLFKPFSRLHNDSEFEGSGAGLAIVERIISRHHGKIWAESKKGEGAVFYFKIPHA